MHRMSVNTYGQTYCLTCICVGCIFTNRKAMHFYGGPFAAACLERYGRFVKPSLLSPGLKGFGCRLEIDCLLQARGRLSPAG